MGIVDELKRGRDGRIRVVLIKYRNSKEGIDRVTERSVRKVVKLWGIDDLNLAEDLAELGKRFDDAKVLLSSGASEEVANQPTVRAGLTDIAHSCNTCCCEAHHVLSAHLKKNQIGSRPIVALDPDVGIVAHLMNNSKRGESSSITDGLDDLLESFSDITM